MFFSIPTSTDPFFDEVVNLDGTDYHLTFNYNQREDCYYLSIGTPNGDDIINGLKLVTNWPLLHNQVDTRLPPGELFVFANTPNDGTATLGQLGDGLAWTLFYATTSQLP